MPLRLARCPHMDWVGPLGLVTIGLTLGILIGLVLARNL
jgi:hypothetical protein